MDSKSIFSVPIPSIPTPFMPNGDIDFSALSNMLERYISWGSTVLMLTAGDSHSTSGSKNNSAILNSVSHP